MSALTSASLSVAACPATPDLQPSPTVTDSTKPGSAGKSSADLTLTDHAAATQAVSHHIVTVDQLFIDKPDNAAAVAALDHDTLISPESGQIGGQVMYGQGGIDDQPVQVGPGERMNSGVACRAS